MGKASSSKKVARVAGTGGGKTARARAPWSYFGVIALVVVVGVALTWSSRSRYQNQLSAATNANATVQPTVGTTWYEGYVVDICGTLAKPISKPKTSSGISTAGDGVITITPAKKQYAGKNATLGAFASSVGLTLAANQVGVPGGKTYVNGDTCGGKSAQLYVKQFPFVGSNTGVLQTKVDAPNVRLANDALVTLAFVPASEKGAIPAPPKSVQTALTKAATPTTTPTTAPTTTTTTPASKKSASKKSASKKASSKKASSTTASSATASSTTSTTTAKTSTTS